MARLPGVALAGVAFAGVALAGVALAGVLAALLVGRGWGSGVCGARLRVKGFMGHSLGLRGLWGVV